MLSKIAVTIAIAPKMYISYRPIDGVNYRSPWSRVPTFHQREYLINRLVQVVQLTGHKIEDYYFEQHEDGRVHLHAYLTKIYPFNEGEKLDEFKCNEDADKFTLVNYFCNGIKKNMSQKNRDETFYIKDIFDVNGWLEYIHKTQKITSFPPILKKDHIDI